MGKKEIRTKIAIILLLAGLLYVACVTIFVAVTGGGAWKAGAFTIKVLSLKIPLKIFWYILLISLILIISESHSAASLKEATRSYGASHGELRLIQSPSSYVLILAIIFVLAFLLRLYGISEPPLDFHPTRQYKNAIIARYFYDRGGARSGIFKDIKEPEGNEFYDMTNVFTEPPLIELASVGLYHIAGRECLTIPRILSSLLWIGAALLLWKIMLLLASRDAALLSTAFFLFTPFAIRSSRAFMPDPLMIFCIMAYIYSLARFVERPGRGTFYVTAFCASLAIFAKVSSGFFIMGSAIVLYLFRHELRKQIRFYDAIAFCVIAILPIVAYTKLFLKLPMGGGLFGWLFLPSRLLVPFTYIQRLHLIDDVVTLVLFFTGLGGLFLLRGAKRTLLMGLMAGYLAFCLIFNYHTATHDYYHMPLIPIVAIGLGILGDYMLCLLRDKLPRLRIYALIALAVILFAFSVEGISRLDRKWAGEQLETYREIGVIVRHSRRTFILAPWYGSPLKYHGWVEGFPWPTQSDLSYMSWEGTFTGATGDYFRKEYDRQKPDYFIVTAFDELEKQPDLKELLEENFPLTASSPSFRIYDLRENQRQHFQRDTVSSLVGGLQVLQGRYPCWIASSSMMEAFPSFNVGQDSR